MNRVIVVGGGASGLMAAAAAASRGAKTILLEKNDRCGKKLSICGKGRGNVTNTADKDAFIAAFGKGGRFLYSAFSVFFRDELLLQLEKLGIDTVAERGGRVFPSTQKAASVTDALVKWCRDEGVRIKTGARVLAPEISDSAIAGVRVFGGVMPADSVIIATGGLSYPGTGSTGDGYGFARAAGHTVTPLGPSLCGMITDEKWPAALSGLSLKNVKCTLARPGGKALASETGEMLFTHKGVSGPIILTLSKTAAEAGGPLVLVIDLKPYIPAEELENSFRQAFCGKGLLKGYMEKRLPKAMVPALPVIKEACGLPLSGITAKQRKELVSAMKNVKLSIKSLCPIEEAIITKGGVSTAEVDPKTMASRIVRGLYFCGEILDIDAVTGGYNLQAAFSTGYVAGINAALSKEEEKR